MQLVVPRLFYLTTIAAYLVAGSTVYKDLKLTEIYFEIPEVLEKNQSDEEISRENIQLHEPDIKFENLHSSIIKKVEKNSYSKLPKLQWKAISKFHHLNTIEPIYLMPHRFDLKLNSNLVSLYRDIEEQNSDSVSTQLAKSDSIKEDDVVFYDYSEPEVKNIVEAVDNKAHIVEAVDNKAKIVEAVDNNANIVEAVDNKTHIVEAVDNKAHIVEAVDNKTHIVEAVDNKANIVEAVDNKANIVEAVDNKAHIVEAVDNKANIVEAVDNKANIVEAVDNKANIVEEIYNVNDLITYDYSRDTKKAASVKQSKSTKKKRSQIEYPSKITLKAVGIDLHKTTEISGFEVVSHDDYQESQDYSAGFVEFNENLKDSKMNRTTSISKLGYVNTHFDMTYEKGWSEIFIPMFQSEMFNKLISPYEKYGDVGILLLELDDETEEVKVDVKYGEEIELDENFQVTKNSDYRYKLFVGIQAGNALITYTDGKKNTISKITHIHSMELTFDANIYEEGKVEIINLFEKDILSNDKSILNISGKDVKIFAKDEIAQKVKLNGYKINFQKVLLGSRNYIELTHLEESIFIGFKDRNEIEVPSELFMRHIIEGVSVDGLQSRCIIQINLEDNLMSAEVGQESVGNSLMTYIQYLDSDGKFYDSPSPKTEKMIIVGENAASEKINQDSKINVKLNYKNNSVQYVGSYCSPNTYLVEQL